MADAKAQKEDMESKLAELQSINKDEFRTPGFAIDIFLRHVRSCIDEEGEALGWLGTGKPRKYVFGLSEMIKSTDVMCILFLLGS